MRGGSMVLVIVALASPSGLASSSGEPPIVQHSDLAAGDLELPSSLRDWPVPIERPRFSRDGARIAFSSAFEGASDLFVVDVVSGDVTRLTDTPHADRRPSWSPDGSHIVFQSDRGGSVSLWTIALADRSVRRLTDGAHIASAPDWSPAGGWITYVSDARGSWDVWRVRVDGTGAQPVTTHPGNEYHPKFSPDGSEIVFYPTWTGWTDIDVVDIESGTVREVLSGEHEDYRPAYDPSGSRIVFASDRQDSSGLWVVDGAGGEPTRVLSSPGGLDYPDWSPDGRWILFLAEEHFSQIDSVSLDGGSTTPVIDAPSSAMDRRPSVSVDGKWLAYETDRLGNEGNVVLRNLTSGDERRVSRGRINDGAPRFSPDGSRIVYTSSGGDQASSEAVIASVDGGAGVQVTDRGNVGFPSFCGADRIVFAWAAVAYTSPHELWSVRDGEEPRRVGEHVVERTGVSCERRGRWLVASLYQPPGSSGARPRLVRIDLTTGRREVLTEDTVPHLQPRLSPDGGTVAYVRASGVAGQLFVVPTEGGASRAVLAESVSVGAPAWLGEGRLVYSRVTEKDAARLVRAPDRD